MRRRSLLSAAAVASCFALGSLLCDASVSSSAPIRKKTVRPNSSPAITAITRQTLATNLRKIGYDPKAEGAYQRVKVQQEKYEYTVDFNFSNDGYWLVAMAHLAPVPDLTRLRANPLLTLLSTNDELLGMYFSYDRVNGRIMLNSVMPVRGLDATALTNRLNLLRGTVVRTEALWDTAHW